MYRLKNLVKDYYWKGNTLVLVFYHPIGQSSNNFDKQETLFDLIENYFMDLDGECDWRDDYTLEIHGLYPDHEDKIFEGLIKTLVVNRKSCNCHNKHHHDFERLIELQNDIEKYKDIELNVKIATPCAILDVDVPKKLQSVFNTRTLLLNKYFNIVFENHETYSYMTFAEPPRTYILFKKKNNEYDIFDPVDGFNIHYSEEQCEELYKYYSDVIRNNSFITRLIYNPLAIHDQFGYNGFTFIKALDNKKVRVV